MVGPRRLRRRGGRGACPFRLFAKIALIARSSSIKKQAALFPVGKRIAGRFRVELVLGEGAVAAVYRVQDERTGAQLALKQLRPPAGSDFAVAVGRFEHEYHTLTQLSHPHIVAVYDYGTEAESPFYTMKLLEGGDAQTIAPLPWQQACRILYDVASALALLHSRGLVHRDISPRNVHCDQNGRATLIDFGALSPMDAHRQVIGTPPFVPPEALQLQGLDARADLYALGALGYWLIAREHAYPARNLRALPEMWRRVPAAAISHAPEMPRLLSDLVTQLLQLEREARPATAAEVMERVSGIAGIAHDEPPEVTRAYLNRPRLVGRDGPLQEVHAALERVVGERLGACFLVEGERGSGRSRFLDACVLEAELEQLLVVRAHGTEGTAAYGLARAVCSQLWREAPELCQRCLPPRAVQLGFSLLIPELGGAGHAMDTIARAQRQLAMRDFILAFVATRPLLIAVDDLEFADEPSVAWLATLCHAAPSAPLALLLTRKSEATRDAAIDAVRSLSRVLALQPLDPAQASVLLRSIFGDAEHLASLSLDLHRMAQGSPRMVLALCERLVEQGVARYEAGQWRLPVEYSPELPASLSDALWERIAALPAAARELAEILALTEPLAIAPGEYPSLMEGADPGSAYRALDALLAAGVLCPSGERYRFMHEQVRGLLERRLPPERARGLHARLFTALQRCGHGALLPYELLQSGREREAIELVLGRHAFAAGHPRRLDLLERLVKASERLGLPVGTKIQLRRQLVLAAMDLGELTLFEPHADWLLHRLQRDSGVADERELQGDLDTDSRCRRALELAAERHAAASAEARGLPPAQSLELLLELCGAYTRMAATAQCIELVERLPSLRAWYAVVPSAALCQPLIDIQLAMQAGRYDETLEISAELLQRLEAPHPRMLRDQVELVRADQQLLNGMMGAVIGDRRALAWTAPLEERPGWRAHAYRMRMVLELTSDESAAARESQRQAELLNVLDGGGLLFPGTIARVELLVNWFASDLLAVKRVTERIEGLAARYPGWRTTANMGRYYYHRLKGDYPSALEVIRASLQLARPGRHFDWGTSALGEAHVLAKMGRFEEALQQALEYQDICRKERLWRTESSLLQPITEALIGLGRAEEAEPLADLFVAANEALGAGGLVMAFAYALRARVCLALGDESTAREFVHACLEQTGATENPSKSPIYRQLSADAEARGFTL